MRALNPAAAPQLWPLISGVDRPAFVCSTCGVLRAGASSEAFTCLSLPLVRAGRTRRSGKTRAHTTVQAALDAYFEPGP
eukprot:5473337-Alexandrium_andersonii.AAC.1